MSEIPVTAEMIQAGEEAWAMVPPLPGFLSTIYRAMAALAPTTFTFEQMAHALASKDARIAALEAQRNEVVDRLAKVQSDNTMLRAERDAWQKLHGDLQATLTAPTTPPAPEPRAFPAAALRPSRGHTGRMG